MSANLLRAITLGIQDQCFLMRLKAADKSHFPLSENTIKPISMIHQFETPGPLNLNLFEAFVYDLIFTINLMFNLIEALAS